jgi:hypothetical protein
METGGKEEVFLGKRAKSARIDGFVKSQKPRFHAL